ncbi:GNAT family N-acetyltransferase [Halorarius halobius]|uniref:GNAT family N-acetyltransferase n=1 Tax=Halorarius halobius TaxID=2962671 RepID=UPI0020CB988B|nr:GNAT family protein [Halorarius halobius]
MPGPVFIEGETVDLHPIEVDDAPFLERLVNDPAVRAGLGSHASHNEQEEREWVESLGGEEVHLLACVDGDPVGTFGLNDVNEVWGTTELGYMILPDHWGNGYATDAAALICGHAFDERRLAKVYAHVYETNPASARVLEKVGFEQEGLLRQHAFVDGERVDVERYGLLADELER